MARQSRSQRSQTPTGSAGRSPRTSRNYRQTMQQRARRRRQGKMVRRVIFTLLIAAAIVMAPTVFFRVSKVTVTGDTRYTDEELVRISGVQEGDNMFFLDTGHIISLLEAKYPYLDTIQLHRRMPSTLQIEVTDRVPILSIENNGSYLLMDRAGKVLEKTGSVAENTTEVIGASPDGLKPGDWAEDDSDGKKDQKHEKILAVLRLMELMTQYEMQDCIRSVDIDKAYDVRVQYEDRYTILLGSMDKEKLEHKIQFLQAILKEPSLPESGIIDLTGDSEARYRPQEDSTSNKTVVFEDKTEEPAETQTPDDTQTTPETDTDKPAETTPETTETTPPDTGTTEDTPPDTGTTEDTPESGQGDNTAAVTIWTDRRM
ncbi:MAG: FtsQ-type POTRA domain-containing protein [Clostridiales bacterium]|nr:FtsQ-type POTRA domain-containing protein [Clostridiales bacterium]